VVGDEDFVVFSIDEDPVWIGQSRASAYDGSQWRLFSFRRPAVDCDLTAVLDGDGDLFVRSIDRNPPGAVIHTQLPLRSDISVVLM